MNFLSMLLGQQAGAKLAGDVAGDIIVQANKAGQPEAPLPTDQYENFLIGNRRAVEEVRAAEEESAEAAQRKGMFGVKGTLRDVLGLVGDAFLVQGGKDTVYAPQRQREKIADAMAGFSVDPVAAAERVTGVDPVTGQEFYKNYLVSENQETQNQLRQSEFNRSVENDLFEGDLELRDRAARLLAAAGNDPAKRAEAINQISLMASQRKRSLSDLGVSPNMTDAQAEVYSGGDMRVNQTKQIPYIERRVATSERNARTAERRAARPPAPRSTSDSERAIAIGNKPESQRTEGEKIFLRRYQEGTGGGSILETFRQRQGQTGNPRLGPPRQRN
jgi:hypothetical protein